MAIDKKNVCMHIIGAQLCISNFYWWPNIQIEMNLSVEVAPRLYCKVSDSTIHIPFFWRVCCESSHGPYRAPNLQQCRYMPQVTRMGPDGPPAVWWVLIRCGMGAHVHSLCLQPFYVVGGRVEATSWTVRHGWLGIEVELCWRNLTQRCFAHATKHYRTIRAQACISRLIGAVKFVQEVLLQ